LRLLHCRVPFPPLKDPATNRRPPPPPSPTHIFSALRLFSPIAFFEICDRLRGCGGIRIDFLIWWLVFPLCACEAIELLGVSRSFSVDIRPIMSQDRFSLIHSPARGFFFPWQAITTWPHSFPFSSLCCVLWSPSLRLFLAGRGGVVFLPSPGFR